jgi:hypothetical protein
VRGVLTTCSQELHDGGHGFVAHAGRRSQPRSNGANDDDGGRAAPPAVLDRGAWTAATAVVWRQDEQLPSMRVSSAPCCVVRFQTSASKSLFASFRRFCARQGSLSRSRLHRSEPCSHEAQHAWPMRIPVAPQERAGGSCEANVECSFPATA